MAIQKTRFVLIDSSTLNKVAKDFRGTDLGLRRHAMSVFDSLNRENWIPVITLHHLLEIVQHANLLVVQERLRFLQAFPLLGYIKPFGGPQFPGTGSVVDVLAREVRAVICGSKTIDDTVNAVGDKLLNVSSGERLIHSDSHSVDILRQHAGLQHREGMEIASIARSDAANTRAVPFSAMIKGRPRTGEERRAFMEGFRKRLGQDLIDHGDNRIENTKAVSEQFSLSVSDRNSTIRDCDPLALEHVLSRFGISMSEIAPETTQEDIGFLAIFRENLNIVRPLIDENPQSIGAVNQEQVPSWRLSREILRRQNKETRVKGSNLTDFHLASLVFYVDAIEVDKTTLEYTRQIAKNDLEVAKYTDRFVKCSTYADLPEKLQGLTHNA